MSDAVKLNAHLWARHPDDWYVEPTWCPARLFDVEQFDGKVWDPACGLGRIPAAAIAAGMEAIGSDKVLRVTPLPSWQWSWPVDFLDGEKLPIARNIVSNPPFSLAQAFVRQALQTVSGKVAMLLPAKFLHSEKRRPWFARTPLARVWILSSRPSMPPGPVIEAGISPGGGKADFIWMVWDPRHSGPVEMRWLGRAA